VEVIFLSVMVEFLAVFNLFQSLTLLKVLLWVCIILLTNLLCIKEKLLPGLLCRLVSLMIIGCLMEEKELGS